MKQCVIAALGLLLLSIAVNGALLRHRRQVKTSSANTAGGVSANSNGAGNGTSTAQGDTADADATVQGVKTTDGSDLNANVEVEGNLSTDGVSDMDAKSTGVGTAKGNNLSFGTFNANERLNRLAGRGEVVGSFGGLSENGGLARALMALDSRTLNKLSKGQATGEALGDQFSTAQGAGSAVSDQNDSRTQYKITSLASGLSDALAETSVVGQVGEVGDFEKNGTADTIGKVTNFGSMGEAVSFGESETLQDTDAFSSSIAQAISEIRNAEIPKFTMANAGFAAENDLFTNSLTSGSQAGSGPGDVSAQGVNIAEATEIESYGINTYQSNVTFTGETAGHFASSINANDLNGETAQTVIGNNTGRGDEGYHQTDSKIDRNSGGFGSNSVREEGVAAGANEAEIQQAAVLTFDSANSNKAETLIANAAAVGDDAGAAAFSEGQVNNNSGSGNSLGTAEANGMNDAGVVTEAAAVTDDAQNGNGGAMSNGDGLVSGSGATVTAVGTSTADSPGATGNDGFAQVSVTGLNSQGALELFTSSNVATIDNGGKRKKRSTPQLTGFKIRSMEHNGRKYWLTEEINPHTGVSVLRPLTLMELLTTFNLRVATNSPFSSGTNDDLRNAVLYTDEQPPTKVQRVVFVHPIGLQQFATQ